DAIAAAAATLCVNRLWHVPKLTRRYVLVKRKAPRRTMLSPPCPRFRETCKYGRASKVSGQFTSERRSDMFAAYAVTTLARTRAMQANCGVARKTRHARVRPALC